MGRGWRYKSPRPNKKKEDKKERENRKTAKKKERTTLLSKGMSRYRTEPPRVTIPVQGAGLWALVRAWNKTRVQ